MESRSANTSPLAEIVETRERTLALVGGLSDAQLSRIVTPLLSPLYWDLGHIANFEQFWLLGSDDDDFNALYDPFRQSRAGRGELPVLRGDDCFAYMQRVRARVAERFDELDSFRVELVIQHEQQHNETMLQLLRMMEDYTPPASLLMAGDALAPGDRAPGEGPGKAPPEVPGDCWVRYPAGAYRVGSTPSHAGQFVYDNELEQHDVELEAFEIAARPVLNGEYREWIAGGGYAKFEHWSPAGREWLAAEGVSEPLGWLRDGSQVLQTGFGDPRPLNDTAPVIHISWFEADAYARAHGARLPAEHEWEVAASYDPTAGPAPPRRRHAWGDEDWSPDRANLDQHAFGTLPCGTFGSGDGCVDLAGQAWEWTASEFAPYPGFQPFCYERYSAPFFNAGYRVLRGGSWATRARSVDNRFRNWDHPQRRQIFAGLRLARDA